MHSSDGEYSRLLSNQTQQLCYTYREIARSRLVAEQVIRNLSLDISGEELREQSGVSVIPDTQIMEIAVDFQDAELAAAIANEMAIVLQEDVQALIGLDNIQVIDRASVPAGPFRPRPMLNFLVAVVTGTVMAVTLVLLFFYSEDQVRPDMEINQLVGVPMLGKVHRAWRGSLCIFKFLFSRRHKIRSFLKKERGREDFRYMSIKLGRLVRKEEMKSLVLLSPGREVGRTVIAARLAEAYSRFGSRVLLIDGDLSNPIIHEIYKLGKEPGFSDLLNGEAAYAEVINQVRPGLEIITAGSFAAGREIFLPGRVKEVLGELSRLYDLILLDSSAAKSSADSILLASCTDAAILVCQTGRTTINELKDLQAQLAMVDARSAGIIINRV